VKTSGEQLQTDDGVNDDDEYYEQRNVKQRHHSFENRIENNLKTCIRQLNQSVDQSTNLQSSIRPSVHLSIHVYLLTYLRLYCVNMFVPHCYQLSGE